MIKSKWMLIIISVVLLLAVLPIVSACGQPSATGGGVIKIGDPSPLTGPASMWGLSHDRGLQMIIDDINAAGGINVGGKNYTFKLIPVDTKFTVEGATAAAQKLAYQDKVQYAITMSFTLDGDAMQKVFKESGTLNSGPSWGRNSVTPNDIYHFRCPASPHETGYGIFKILIKTYPNAKKWAFMGIDNEDSLASHDYLLRPLQDLGLQLAGYELFPADATDLYPVLSKVLKDNPDGIQILSAYPQIDALICKQAREKGFTGPIMHAAPLAVQDILNIAGPAAEDFLACEPTESGPQATPAIIEFRKRYEQKYGEWGSDVLNSGCIFQALPPAMKKANSVDVKDVLKVLQAGNFEYDTYYGKTLISGKAIHGINNVVFPPMAINRIKNGQHEILTILSAKDQVSDLETYWAK